MFRGMRLGFAIVFIAGALLFTSQSCPADQIYAQVSPPISAITSPLDGATVTGTAVTITGTAADSSGPGLSKVEVSVNGGDWKGPADGVTDTSAGHDWTSWSYSLVVYTAGYYVVTCRATDTSSNVENPTSVVHLIITIPKHSISGTTTYTGTGSVAGSKVYIGVFEDASFNGTVAKAGPLAVGAFTIPNVSDGTWYLGAFKSIASGGDPYVQLNDPYGLYGGISTPAPVTVSGSAKTGINITLEDTTNNPIAGIGSAKPNYYDYTDSGGGKDMQIELIYWDPNQQAKSVMVAGPGISETLSLTWNSSDSAWEGGDLDLGASGWPAAPLTYTFTVTPNTGSVESLSCTIPQYMTDFATDLYPSGGQTVYGNSVIFSWSLVPSALEYRVHITDKNSLYWDGPYINGNTYTYNSSSPGYTALTPGTKYYYQVEARNAARRTYREENFVYQSSTDTTAPTATIDYPNTGAKLGGASCNVAGTATHNKGVQYVQLSIDAGANWFTANDASGNGSWSKWTFDWPLAQTGSYTLKARAVDLSNNVQATPASVTVTVDKTPPTSHITAPRSGSATKTAPVTISGKAADNTGGSGVHLAEIKITNSGDSTVLDWTAATGTASWTYNWTPPAADEYTVQSRATDVAGNVETPGTGITFSFDTTPAYSAITAPTSGTYLTASPYVVTGTAGDATSGVAKVEVSTNGGTSWTALPAADTKDSWTHWSYPWTLPADGPYTIKSRATDKAGNVETPGAGVSVRVDKTKPASVIKTPLTGLISKNSIVTITGTATDSATGSGVATVEVSTDGGTTWTSTGVTDTSGAGTWATWSYGPTLSDGKYSLKSRATDKAGNVEVTTTKTAVAITVDTSAPTSSITQPLNGDTLGGESYVIKGTATDGSGTGVKSVQVGITPSGSQTTMWYTAKGTTSWSYTWTLPASLQDYSIQSKATDVAGNVETPGAGVTITANKTMPVSTITAPTAGKLIGGTTYKVTGTASCVGATVSYVDVTWDNGANWHRATGTTSWSYTWTLPSPDGSYTLLTRATNSQTIPEVEVVAHKAGVTVTVDGTAPESIITSPSPGTQYIKGGSTTYLITGTASDAGSGVAKVQVGIGREGAAPVWSTASGTTSWSQNWKLPADGMYTIQTKATDGAGNVETVTDAMDILVDRTTPGVYITSPPSGILPHATTYTIKGYAADSGSGVAYVNLSFDNNKTWVAANYAPGPSPNWSYVWTPAADGTYNIQLQVADKAGNVLTTTASLLQVTVDSTPPVVTIDTPTLGTNINTKTYQINGTATDAVSGVAKIEVSFDGGNTWVKSSTGPVTGSPHWTYNWTITIDDVLYTKSVMARATDKAGNVSDPVIVPISISDPIYSGIWNYTVTHGTHVRKGLVNITIDGQHNVTAVASNTCKTTYTGTMNYIVGGGAETYLNCNGSEEYFQNNQYLCGAIAAISPLTFTSATHASGTVVISIPVGQTATLTLTR